MLRFAFPQAQEIEDQRKFTIKNTEAFEICINDNPTIGGTTLLFHSNDTYYDLYLDSPDFILKRNGLCLRFRKRISAETGISYSFQLKSEMGLVNSKRMEVEESDLSIYQFVQDTEIVDLIEILDPLFCFADLKIWTEEILKNAQTLQNWLLFKAGSPILPFQQLISMNEQTFNIQTIGSFRPVLVGKSSRSRFHGVLDTTQNGSFYSSIPRNKIPFDRLPNMLQKNSNLNWIFEASFDKSEFISFDKFPKTTLLTEFEIENKYSIPETGTQVIDNFQKELEKIHPLITGKLSKYAQAANLLLE
jgi:hypothetical protein